MKCSSNVAISGLTCATIETTYSNYSTVTVRSVSVCSNRVCNCSLFVPVDVIMFFFCDAFPFATINVRIHHHVTVTVNVVVRIVVAFIEIGDDAID